MSLMQRRRRLISCVVCSVSTLTSTLAFALRPRVWLNRVGAVSAVLARILRETQKTGSHGRTLLAITYAAFALSCRGGSPTHSANLTATPDWSQGYLSRIIDAPRKSDDTLQARSEPGGSGHRSVQHADLSGAWLPACLRLSVCAALALACLFRAEAHCPRPERFAPRSLFCE